MKKPSDEAKKTQQEAKRKETLEIVLYSVIGLAITVGSFAIFHFFERLPLLTAFLCCVDVSYAYLHARVFFKSKDWQGARRFFIPLMMIAYWSIAFAIICIFNSMIIEGDFSYRFFLYPIFLLPSFVLEILIVGLICSGI
ncbi:MAG: hypothetical protein IJX97_00605 [Clostridia bacterium]|nr:hypothetical protein [Clostridia bacterium]